MDTSLPPAAQSRPGERGLAPVLLAVIVLVIFIFLIIFVTVLTNQRMANGVGPDAQATGGVEGDQGYAAAEDGSDIGPLVAVKGCIIFSRHPRVTPRFISKMIDISGGLRTDPNFLMATIKIESDFDPLAANPYSSARGLNQMLDASARMVGLPSANAFRNLSAVQQLDYVKLYYIRSGGLGKLNTPEDCYLITFYPAAAGKSPAMVLFTKRNPCTKDSKDAYCSNRPYDRNNDGVITKGEAGFKARATYDGEIRKCPGGGNG